MDEFLDFTVDNWLDNSKWLGIKLLVDVTSDHSMNMLKNVSYAQMFKEILTHQGNYLLSWSSSFHLGPSQKNNWAQGFGMP
jgi:hypothetical protein